MNIPRDILYNEHRLSHQQIDDLLHENHSKDYLGEKMELMAMLRYFHEITSLLRKQKTWFIVLKGPLLSERIYNDPTYRLMKDFDIMVKPESVNGLVRLLAEKGYEPAYFPWPSSSRKQKITRRYMNQFGMYNHQTGAMAEVHWRPFGHPPAPDSVVFKLIEENLETTTFAGREFFRFNTEFELAYITIHGANHNWFRLKWLVDLNEMLRRYSYNKDLFNHIIRDLGAERFVDATNVVLKTWFSDGQLLPDQNSGFSNLGLHANTKIEETTRAASRKKKSYLRKRLHTIQNIRLKMQFSPRLVYKMDIIRMLAFCKIDLKYRWIPPYTGFYYLFRPFGYLYRKAIGEDVKGD